MSFLYDKHACLVRHHTSLPLGSVAGYVLVLPYVTYGVFARNAEVGKVGYQRERLVLRVEQCYGVGAVGKLAHEYLIAVG